MFILLACVENTLERREETPVGEPAIRVEPGSLSFEALPLGASSVQSLTIQNEGAVDLHLDTVTFGGLSGGAFTLPEDPTGTTLAAGESRSWDVVYTVIAADSGDMIRVVSDDPYEPYVYVPVAGEGLFGMLSASPNPVDFGSTEAGITRELDVTLENVGHADLGVSSLLVTDEAFALVDAPALPLTLAPSEDATITLSFTPPADGRYSGILWAMTDDPVGLHNVALTGSAGVPLDETDTTEDVCAESEYGTDPRAGTRIFVEDDTQPVVVTYLGTDAGYTNELWIDAPESRRLATGYSTPVGTTVELGPYPVGTELIFATVVRDTGDRFESGPASRNSDREVHAATTYLGDCSWKLGFEDLEGGGDRDYDDIQMMVSGVLGQSD